MAYLCKLSLNIGGQLKGKNQNWTLISTTVISAKIVLQLTNVFAFFVTEMQIVIVRGQNSKENINKQQLLVK